MAAAKRIYAARNRGDVDAVLYEFHPDAAWQPHLATLGGRPIRETGFSYEAWRPARYNPQPHERSF